MIIDLHFLPNVEYFTVLANFESVKLESHEHFQRQSFRNRCHILTPGKVDVLTVPVNKSRKHLPIMEVTIDNGQPWQNRIWRAIKSAYGKAPFFDFYSDSFADGIYQRHELLFELNSSLLTICLEALKMPIKVCHTDQYQHGSTGETTDLRGVIHPKKKSGIIHVQPYVQVFEGVFQQNLSVLDLIFCQGPLALATIRKQSCEYLA